MLKAQYILAREVETSKEVTWAQEGVQEGGEDHASKIVMAAQEGVQERADACGAREVSLRGVLAQEVDTSKEVGV
jgi:hypothetical protein